MGKFNKKASDNRFDAENKLAGGFGMNAAKQEPEARLRRCILANLLWEDNFYQDGKLITDYIKELVPQVEGKVVASLVLEAREKQKLRHTPLLLIVEMLKHESHKEYVAPLVPQVCTRADQLTDLVALYWKENVHRARQIKGQTKQAPLAKQLVKGLQVALNNFTEYEYAKYNRKTEVKFRDLIFLTHVKAKSQEQEALFNRVINDELATPDTWEVGLSTTPREQHHKVWERLITDKKLGALAFLRNMRNMKEAGLNANIIRQGLKNLNTRMLLPLNFFSAVKYAPEFRSDIERLMLDGWAKLPKLAGHTIFVVDVSGSMWSRVAAKSEWTRLDVAKAMAVLAANMCERIEIWCTAGNDAQHIHATEQIAYPHPGFELSGQVDTLRDKLGGGGIFTRQCLEHIKARRNASIPADRIIVFSDSQDCDAENRMPAPFATYNYIVDVSAHTHGVNYKGVWTAEVSGWSEHFLTFIAAMEGVNNEFLGEE